MTEKIQQSETPAQNETQTNSPDVGKLRDNKKEKCRPMTKVIIRRLPPGMTQDQFMEQVSPLPEHDYLYFVKADMSLGQYAFSRAYINFIDQQDIFMFREKFDNYIFVDSKGTEYPAVVEFAPFQRLPKKRIGKKKDLKCGTIESDPYYKNFLESLQNQETDSSIVQPKTEYSYQPIDNTHKKVTTTPLLEYLKQRKQEKQRLRDEKREERRRRELERRRTKDDPIISKLTYSNEDDNSDYSSVDIFSNTKLEDEYFENSVANMNSMFKSEEEIIDNKYSGEIARVKNNAASNQWPFHECANYAEMHSRCNKDLTFIKKYIKNENKRSDFQKVLKNPDMDKEMTKDNKENKDERDKYSPKDLKNRNKKDEKLREKVPRDRDLKPLTKGYRERIDDRSKDKEIKHQRRYEDKKLYGRRDERDFIKEDRRGDMKDDRRYEIKEDFKECRERKLEEKRGKSYEKMRQEKKRLAETKKYNVELNNDNSSTQLIKNEDSLQITDKQAESYDSTIKSIEESTSEEKIKDSIDYQATIDIQDMKEALEQVENTETQDTVPNERDTGTEKSKSNENISIENDVDHESDEKKESKIVKRRSSLESGGEGGTGDGNCLRRHKSLDGGGPSNLQKSENEDKEKDKKDPRLERRIRNKDRPAMEIYRPGMGKFSKQRLEREKSNNDERASLSQSPTPNNTNASVCKSGKAGTEVRSMTFKRSVSRDIS